MPASDTVVVRLGTIELQSTPPTFSQMEANTVVTQAVIGKGRKQDR